MEGQYCDVDLLCHDRKTGDLSRQYCSDPEWPEGSCSAVCPGESLLPFKTELRCRPRTLGLDLPGLGLGWIVLEVWIEGAKPTWMQ